MEIGTLAPIEVVRAESTVATNQQQLTLAQTNLDRDPGSAKEVGTAAADSRERVLHGGDNPGNAGLQDGIGAGRRLAVMAARLQRYVERRAVRGVAGGR